MVNIVITVNSPGEVAGWLRPSVIALKNLPWPKRIVVCIPPCMFASGAEAEVAASIPGVDAVVGAKSLLRYLLFGQRPPEFQPSHHGIVLFLGGDMTYAVLLAKRLRYPAMAYTEGVANWVKPFSRFAASYSSVGARLLHHGVPTSKISVIGNLMLDAPKTHIEKDGVKPSLKDGDQQILLILPGSRPGHLEYMAGFFTDTMETMADQVSGLKIFFSISPFIDNHFFSRAIAASGGTFIPGQGEPTAYEAPGRIITKNGQVAYAFRGRQYELMAAADLALTIPGTNTVELASFGVPTVVVLPLHAPEKIPLEGLPGLLGNLPVVGRELKRRLIPRMLSKIKFTAWPNRLAGEFVIPEIRGNVTPEMVADSAVALLREPEKRREISGRLREIVGEPGASTRLAQLVWDVLREHYGVDL